MNIYILQMRVKSVVILQTFDKATSWHPITKIRTKIEWAIWKFWNKLKRISSPIKTSKSTIFSMKSTLQK